MDYTIVPGERKGSLFIYLTDEKFLFRQKSKRGGTTYFECFEDCCSARIKIDINSSCSYIANREHIHEIHESSFLKWRVTNEIKEKVRMSTEGCK